MSWNSVKKDFNWPDSHMDEALTDPAIREDVMADTGRDVVSEALNPNLGPSMQGLEQAAQLGSQAVGAATQTALSYGAAAADPNKKVAGRY
jgi:hypothetical protein